MNIRTYSRFALVIGVISLLLVRSALSDQPPAVVKPDAGKTSGSRATREEKSARIPLELARDRARLLHEVYASTLAVMHERYFHGDRATVPARAMEDVFSDMRRHRSIEARWIAASLRAMNIDHDPETPFEKRAASEIRSGKTEVEEVRSGYYRRAVAIPLSGGCINCHGGARSQSTRKHFAGLVITIPVNDGGNSAGAK